MSFTKRLWVKEADNDRVVRCVGKGAIWNATLVCPNTPNIPEQHNKWQLRWVDDEPTVLGSYGDDINEVIYRANCHIIVTLAADITSCSWNNGHATMFEIVEEFPDR